MTMETGQGEEVPHFIAPIIQDNPTGWGPCELPDQFKDMPYQPFSKGDRLGKISDWTGAAFQDKKYASEFIENIIFNYTTFNSSKYNVLLNLTLKVFGLIYYIFEVIIQ